MINAYWLTGPSGSGKSFVLSALRERKDPSILTFDADFVGYRGPDVAWTEWHINPGIFSLMKENAKKAGAELVVVGGVDSDPHAMFSRARTAGYHVLTILPTPQMLRAQRKNRGDSAEKIAQSDDACLAWSDLSRAFRSTLVATSDEAIGYLLGVLRS